MILLQLLVLSSNTKFGKIERTCLSPVFCVLVNNTSDNLMCAKYLQRLLDIYIRYLQYKKRKEVSGNFLGKVCGVDYLPPDGPDYPPRIFHQISAPLKID